MCAGAGAQSKFRGSSSASEGGSEPLPPDAMVDSVEPAGPPAAEAGPLTLQVTRSPSVRTAFSCVQSLLGLAYTCSSQRYRVLQSVAD